MILPDIGNITLQNYKFNPSSGNLNVGFKLHF